MTGVRVGSVECGHCVVRSAESVDDHPLLVNRVGGVSAWRAGQHQEREHIQRVELLVLYLIRHGREQAE